MYELLENIKRLGRDINDFLSGKNVEQAIKEELIKSRTLSAGITLEPVIVLESLRLSNKIKTYGLNDNDIDNILYEYVKGGYGKVNR